MRKRTEIVINRRRGATVGLVIPGFHSIGVFATATFRALPPAGTSQRIARCPFSGLTGGAYFAISLVPTLPRFRGSTQQVFVSALSV